MSFIAYRSCPDVPLSAGLQSISVHRIGPRRLVPGGAVRGEVVDLAHDRGEGVAGGQFVLAAQRHLAALQYILQRGAGARDAAFHRADRAADRKSTRLNSSHYCASRMPSSA